MNINTDNEQHIVVFENLCYAVVKVCHINLFSNISRYTSISVCLYYKYNFNLSIIKYKLQWF